MGTIKLGSMECPICREGTLNKSAIKKETRDSGFGQVPLAVVCADKTVGKKYRRFTERDMEAYSAATKHFETLKSNMVGNLSASPNEPISTDYDWVLKPPMFGLTKWGDLFNPRQGLALVTLVSKVRLAYEHVLAECGDQEYAKAIGTYLALCVDRVADYNSSACFWHNRFEMAGHTFARQAIAIAWDYCEINPLERTVGAFQPMLEAIVRVIEELSKINAVITPKVVQGTATKLPYPNEFFDVVITDPPYYDAVPYADLSDFFYVWLKRSVGSLYPELFATPLAPKTDEIVHQSGRVTSVTKRIKDKQFYETHLSMALSEMARVLKPDGTCVVVFAHKTTTAWENLVSALLSAGFRVTSSWPLHTEQRTRLRAHQSAVLASSVWLVCRKRHLQSGTGSWKTIQSELNDRVKERLQLFLDQGIRGADALLSAIGPALEVFGKYDKVEKVTGETVTIEEFLDKVREVVAHHALSTVLSEQELGNVDAPTAFYVLWKWNFEQNGPNEKEKSTSKSKINGNAFVPYDDALKLARSVGADPEFLLKTHVLEQDKENVRLLGPNDRKHVSGLGEMTRDGAPPATIDMIHKALILWTSTDHVKLEEYLKKSGASNSETFWRVAQALSNILPLQSKEKQWLDGLLGSHAGGSEVIRPDDLTSLDKFMKKE
jgi:adenine-specific DNA methylase